MGKSQETYNKKEKESETRKVITSNFKITLFNTVELFTPGEVQNKKKTFTKFGKYSLKLYFNTEDFQFIINCNIQHS